MSVLSTGSSGRFSAANPLLENSKDNGVEGEGEQKQVVPAVKMTESGDDGGTKVDAVEKGVDNIKLETEATPTPTLKPPQAPSEEVTL